MVGDLPSDASENCPIVLEDFIGATAGNNQRIIQ